MKVVEIARAEIGTVESPKTATKQSTENGLALMVLHGVECLFHGAMLKQVSICLKLDSVNLASLDVKLQLLISKRMAT